MWTKTCVVAATLIPQRFDLRHMTDWLIEFCWSLKLCALQSFPFGSYLLLCKANTTYPPPHPNTAVTVIIIMNMERKSCVKFLHSTLCIIHKMSMTIFTRLLLLFTDSISLTDLSNAKCKSCNQVALQKSWQLSYQNWPFSKNLPILFVTIYWFQ
jgi:hypothetical protein